MLKNKNLALMDDIMGGITQSDEWNEILLHDPAIVAADNRWEAAIEQAKALIPDELYVELHDSHEAKASASGDVGILFGIHVADVIRDVVSRPADLSRYVLKRIDGKA